MLLAGEDAKHPDFLDTVSKVATRMHKLIGGEIGGSSGRGDGCAGPKVELVASKDPTYAAATGAAFWVRTMIDASYCEGFEPEEHHDPHDEL